MSRWQPSLVGEVIGPGTASTTLINSDALWAVLSEPLRKAASTTMVARLWCHRNLGRLSRFLPLLFSSFDLRLLGHEIQGI